MLVLRGHLQKVLVYSFLLLHVRICFLFTHASTVLELKALSPLLRQWQTIDSYTMGTNGLPGIHTLNPSVAGKRALGVYILDKPLAIVPMV